MNNNADSPLELAKQSGSEKMIALLKKYGAKEDLRRRWQISVSRSGGGVITPVFSKGTNELEQFSLLELFAIVFGRPGGFEFGGGSGHHPLEFPDLTHAKIHRITDEEEKEIPTNIDEILASGDCSKDLLLQWGDVVEIPELDRRVNERWNGFEKESLEIFPKCLKRSAKVKVKDETQTVTFAPLIQTTFNRPEGACWKIGTFSPSVENAVFNSGLLRVSSDRNRVHLFRIDPVTKQEKQFILDQSASAKVWIHDGDRIEVPQREIEPPSTIPAKTLRLPPIAPGKAP